MKNLKWAAAFALLAAICAAVILIHGAVSKPAKTAEIIQNGKVIRKIDLENVSEPYEFEVVTEDGKGHNTVRVEKGKIGIISADCPDKICVRQGLITNGTLPVVCLPHRLSVVITDSDDDDDTDAIAGEM